MAAVKHREFIQRLGVTREKLIEVRWETFREIQQRRADAEKRRAECEKRDCAKTALLAQCDCCTHGDDDE